MIDENFINLPVSVRSASEYEPTLLREIIARQLDDIGFDKHALAGKKVVIKPNLVMKKSPEAAATTHPAVLEALLEYLSDAAPREVVIAESSGGPYTAKSLEASYNACGIRSVAEKYGAKLNFDTSFAELEAPGGRLVKSFNVITPIADADVIISLPKLKTHSLTGMSAAVKNYFGVIPGLQKFEMHSRFPDYHDFAAMLCDLALMLHTRARCINLLDAIVGMEGNGPTAGTPRAIGCLLCSENPFALDLLARELIGVGEVFTLDEACARGFAPAEVSLVNRIGDAPEAFAVSDFAMPDSKPHGAIALIGKLCGGRVNELFRPRPTVTKLCVGCGECARSCPAHTIKMVDRKPEFELSACIRCFCCQELCPRGAIKVKTNPFIGFINRAKRGK